MRPSREGLTLAGSILTGVSASLCCVVPIVFTFLGLGGAAFAAAFEPLRPLFIGLTVILLGGAFYLAYGPPSRRDCSPDRSCPPESGRNRMKTVLWVVTVFVLGSLTFPYYVDGLTSALTAANSMTSDTPGGTDPVSLEHPPPGLSRAVIPVEGMTCEGCSSAVKLALMRVEGVMAAEVDHERGEATVIHDENRVGVARILQAINRTGFKAAPPAR